MALKKIPINSGLTEFPKPSCRSCPPLHDLRIERDVPLPDARAIECLMVRDVQETEKLNVNMTEDTGVLIRNLCGSWGI
jgi:hypothetical protein